MVAHLVVRAVVRLLKSTTLSVESRNLLTGCLLERLGAAPIRDIIQVNDGQEILVNGVLLEYDVMAKLQEQAKAALRNQALKLVWDQTRYIALVGGASVGQTPTDLLFYRTAIWNGEQERTYLRLLAGERAE